MHHAVFLSYTRRFVDLIFYRRPGQPIGHSVEYVPLTCRTSSQFNIPFLMIIAVFFDQLLCPIRSLSVLSVYSCVYGNAPDEKHLISMECTMVTEMI